MVLMARNASLNELCGIHRCRQVMEDSFAMSYLVTGRSEMLYSPAEGPDWLWGFRCW
jgi:hypothetical protein